MAKRKLTPELITAIAKDITNGLNNQEACHVNGITKQTFYVYLKTAEDCKDTPRSKLSEHQRNCVDFSDALKNAKILRKRERISKLEQMDSATALIFLLKNEYPAEFNKQPYLIPNFEKLEAYMQSEYTQDEIQAVRDAIWKAEQRRESERQYDENDLFAKEDTE